MGPEGSRTAAAACCLGACLLLAGCHGPPLLARLQPAPVEPAASPEATAPAPLSAAEALRAPRYGPQAEEGTAERERTREMVDAIDRALRERQRRNGPPCPPPSDLMDLARAYGEHRVGRQEEGSIPIDLCRLFELLRKAAAR